MNKKCILGPWIRRFLLEHLVDERNLTYNTQTSYRDTFVLFLPFVAKNRKKSLDHLFIEDISSDILRQFLLHLEEKRGCSVSSRNQRLSAVHALARFVGERNPEHIAWLTQIRSIPFKKTSKPPMTYLEMLSPKLFDRACPKKSGFYKLKKMLPPVDIQKQHLKRIPC